MILSLNPKEKNYATIRSSFFHFTFLPNPVIFRLFKRSLSLTGHKNYRCQARSKKHENPK